MLIKYFVLLISFTFIIQFPCEVQAADEDRELALIAAEQKFSGEEKLDDINPALTENISTEPSKENAKDIRKRKKKFKQSLKAKKDSRNAQLRKDKNTK